MSKTIGRFWSELPDNPDYPAPCPPPQFDDFAPPKKPIEVHCLHCGLRYNSRLIAWGRKIGMQIAGNLFDPALWWCPVPHCDGGGFHHDIYPVAEMGGERAEPLTTRTVSDWEAYKAALPNQNKRRNMIRKDAIHSEWLLARLANTPHA